MPFVYTLEQLARRWGVAPWELEDGLDDPHIQQWVRRGLAFTELEAVEVTER